MLYCPLEIPYKAHVPNYGMKGHDLCTMSIRITSHGAAGTVTGSKHLLEVVRRDGSEARILLDCGMFQGEGLAAGKGKDPNRDFGFEPTLLDAVVLSHAHIDHSGLLPRLVAEGFKGPIWSTPATRDLCALMLEDSARIQESDNEHDRRHAQRNGRGQVGGPLYTPADVPPAMELFHGLDHGESMEILPGITVELTDAGHILGSAVVNIKIDDGEKELRLTYTGDVGRYSSRLLPEPARFPQADVILCETTYGDRDHVTVSESELELLAHVREVCVERQGKLIIPAFSIGKTQDILYTLNALSNAGNLPRIPVFVDSPLAINATGVVRQYEKLFKETVREELHHDPDLFSFPGVEFVTTAERSRQLNSREGPCIIISASGMMEAGRVRHHLYHALPHAQNAVLVVGFCPPGTLGGELLDGATTVNIFGDTVQVNAEILRMDHYSAHADRTELIRFLNCQEVDKVQQLILVHGINKARESFREMAQLHGFRNVTLAEKDVPLDL
jgi:metallo-beta-lactamase family protein